MLDAAKIPYMVIGGQAVLLHGEPRLTMDVDITLGVGRDKLDAVLAALSKENLAPVPPNPADFVRQTNVLPAHDQKAGQRVDLIFTDTPYESQAVARAIKRSIGGMQVRYVCAEDLLIHKIFAGRPRDLEDARGVWLRQKNKLDQAYIEKWLKEFAALPGQEEIASRWKKIQSP